MSPFYFCSFTLCFSYILALSPLARTHIRGVTINETIKAQFISAINFQRRRLYATDMCFVEWDDQLQNDTVRDLQVILQSDGCDFLIRNWKECILGNCPAATPVTRFLMSQTGLTYTYGDLSMDSSMIIRGMNSIFLDHMQRKDEELNICTDRPTSRYLRCAEHGYLFYRLTNQVGCTALECFPPDGRPTIHVMCKFGAFQPIRAREPFAQLFELALSTTEACSKCPNWAPRCELGLCHSDGVAIYPVSIISITFALVICTL